MEVKEGQKRRFRITGKVFTVLRQKESPYKILWVVRNEKTGEEETYEEYIIECFSDIME